MKKLVLSLLALVLISGCSTAPKIEDSSMMTCTQEGEGNSSVTTFTTKGNEIVSSTVTTTIILPTPEDELILESSLLQQKTAFEDFEGIDFNYVIEDGQAVITGVYDLTKVSVEVLPQLGFTDDLKTDGKFTLDKFEEIYKKVGIACEIK
ncbi:hypothetical protein [Anaerorhabdus sp.]|uniref:hypothetical protein n=1 Tax=Anaerorhabdus sp. TaxID=1872524 RepID=UPI002FC60547